MANIFAHSIAVQPTSAAMLVTGADILTQYGVRQSTPTSATIINTPPTFAGIISAVPHTNGSFLITWPAATGPNAPIQFQVYAALGVVSAATLFQDANLVDIGKAGSTQMRIWTLGNQATYFVNGLTYTFGVRAKDGVQNQNTNPTVITATAIGSGNLTVVLQNLAVDLAATEIDLSQDHVNFQADHADFQADHADFMGDHANFQQDHANFQYDHTLISSVSGIIDNANVMVSGLQVLEDNLNNDLIISASNVSGTQDVLTTTQVQLTQLTNQVILINTIISNLNNLVANVSGIQMDLDGNLATVVGQTALLSGIIVDANSNLSGTNLALLQSTNNLSTINSQIVAINGIINDIDAIRSGVSGIEAALAADLAVLVSGLYDLSVNINDSIYNLLLSNENLSGTNLALAQSNWNLQNTSGTLSGAQALSDSLQQSILYIGGVADSVENASQTMDSALQNVQTDITGIVEKSNIIGSV